MLQVYVLDKDAAAGEWVLNHLREIGIEARWMSNVSSLLSHSEAQPPTVCLFAIRPPVGQALQLVTKLSQEPRFSRTAFVLMGPEQYKRSAFEGGADDYISTPPEVIELRKRVRLYLDRAELESRVYVETRITQEMESLGRTAQPQDVQVPVQFDDPVTLLEHAAELTREKNLLELILHYVGEAVAWIDPDGTLLYMNPACETLIDRSAAQVMKQRLTWPLTTDSQAATREIAAALEHGRVWRGEVSYTLPEGRQLDVEMTLAPAHDVSGDIAGYVITQRDLTERKTREGLKTWFLADVAAEMRTLVTNIKMRGYLLRQAPSEQYAVHLRALERETEHLSRLSDAALELSRIDAGMVQMSRERVDLNRLVEDVVSRYRSVAKDGDVTLVLTRDETLPLLLVDPAYLSRAVGELLDNAILHTPGAGQIDVRLGRATWSGEEYATIQVKDTGMGIAPDAQPHIFDRFYRSERARDSGARGVGLGLAIAREIAIRHEGNITVESELHRGSTFTIWLPVKPLSPGK